MSAPAMSVLAHLPDLSRNDALLFVVFCALAVHKIYNKYEVNPANFPATLLLLVLVPTLPTYFTLAHMESRILATLTSYALFYAVLMFSVVLYRISPLHPLAKYPGPLCLKISKFAMMCYAYDGKQHRFFKNLHDKYGSYVRVGPNELSVTDIEAILPILGPDGMRKGPLWIAHYRPGTTPHVVSLRDVNLHHERRKLWSRAFTSASLKELQPIVENRVLQLVEALSKEEGKKVDLGQWMANFTYDFMGDLVFGGGLELMRDGDKNGIRSTLENTMKGIGIVQHVPWITRLLHNLYATSKSALRLRRFAIERYDIRKQQASSRRDLFHYITNEDGLEEMEVPKDQGLNEILAAIVAGADTTSTILAGVFYHLLSNPASFRKLQIEVDSFFPLAEGDPFDAVKLASMPYLNGVINEALRLQPAVPTSVQRSPIEGSGGKWVVGRFIVESTSLYVPPYVLHRDERYFSPSPESFTPERWLDNSGNFTTNTTVFIPFSTGPAICAGKNLALLEMRMVVANLVQKFNIKFAEGYDLSQWERDLQDFFVMKVGKLPVVLTARE